MLIAVSELIDELSERAASILVEGEQIVAAVRAALPQKRYSAWSVLAGVPGLIARFVGEAIQRHKHRTLMEGLELTPVMAIAFTGERLLLWSLDGRLLESIPAAQLDDVYFSMRSAMLSISFIYDVYETEDAPEPATSQTITLELEVAEQDIHHAKHLATTVKEHRTAKRLATPYR
jgi:hypothetical protein